MTAPHTEPPPKPRPSTPDKKNADGSTTITVQRACNACGRELGDATPEELRDAAAGYPLADVRAECGCIAPAPKITGISYANRNNNTSRARNRDIAKDIAQRFIGVAEVQYPDWDNYSEFRDTIEDEFAYLLNAADELGIELLIALAPMPDKPEAGT